MMARPPLFPIASARSAEPAASGRLRPGLRARAPLRRENSAAPEARVPAGRARTPRGRPSFRPLSKAAPAPAGQLLPSSRKAGGDWEPASPGSGPGAEASPGAGWLADSAVSGRTSGHVEERSANGCPRAGGRPRRRSWKGAVVIPSRRQPLGSRSSISQSILCHPDLLSFP